MVIVPDSEPTVNVVSSLRLLILAGECGAAAAARLSPFGLAARKFRLLVSCVDDRMLRRDLLGAYVDAYLAEWRRRRELLAAVAADDLADARAEVAWMDSEAHDDWQRGCWA